jgi:hypothetical protein
MSRNGGATLVAEWWNLVHAVDVAARCFEALRIRAISHPPATGAFGSPRSSP